ncbi:hypothetical protein N7462_002295 [Penicillium macrosclerotiorum]|uniref:uncharacterized protein n=1 Tax=Penicillium macrosclerotiorum TaxID=303699 RepID=UPI002547EDC3|nr:uncharacterized protein N7462_002295 [Penicillium macrosclerotiorum]KAJ5692872.1 hypothetical protein N7462_002295 [Penicillium macrosclerotiorum]
MFDFFVALIISCHFWPSTYALRKPDMILELHACSIGLNPFPEISANNRAGCQNQECKKNKDKIQKGTLRVGVWVESSSFQSWMWRHWGCVTPRIIHNAIMDIFQVDKLTGNENFENIDGWEDLPEEWRVKVRQALVDGHVPDEEWKGDIEMNRPGKHGFRVRASKKAKPEEDEATAIDKNDTAQTDERNDKDPTKENKKASYGKKAASDGVVDTAMNDRDEESVKPKRATRTKKATAVENPKEESKPATKAKRASQTKAPVAISEGTDTTAQPKKRGRPAKTGTTETTKSAAKGTKRKVTREIAETDGTVENPKRSRGRPAKAEQQDLVPERLQRRGRKKAQEN